MWRVRKRRFHRPCQWPRQTSGAVSCYTPSPRGCPTSCTMTLRSVGRGNSVWKCPKQFPCSPPCPWLAPPTCRAAPWSSAVSSSCLQASSLPWNPCSLLPSRPPSVLSPSLQGRPSWPQSSSEGCPSAAGRPWELYAGGCTAQPQPCWLCCMRESVQEHCPLQR